MAKICMASEIAPKRAISVLIYGEPSVGKTTLGCSAANAVLFDYDGGVHRVHPNHLIPTLQVESWEDTAEALRDLQENPLLSGTRTIVIDTAGKMLDFMGEWIMRTDPKKRKFDGTLSLQGFGVRKKEFRDFIAQQKAKGYNLVFIAHETTDKDGELIIKRPLIGGSSTNDLLQEIDLVGYMCYRGNKRTISFNPTDQYYAKNSCFIPDQEVPVVVDAQGVPTAPNNFMEVGIFGAFRTAQERRVQVLRDYNALIADINATLEGVHDVQALTEAVKAISAKPVIQDSKLKARLAVAAKAQELGAKWDAKTSAYVCA